MTTWLFAGPSLWPKPPPLPSDVRLVPPVAAGDVYDAVLAGATRIAIVDGFFGDRAAVRHKELLWALAAGLPVLGAASMGALRAAELGAFGMAAVGRIAADYAAGRRTRDGDVAVAHAPAALCWKPLTVALVDVEARMRRAIDAFGMRDARLDDWLEAVRAIHFTRRTVDALISALASLPARTRPPTELLTSLRSDSYSLKREDALALVASLGQPSPTPHVARPPEDMFHRRELERVRCRRNLSDRHAGHL